MKKYIHLGLILTLVLALALAGCGGGGGNKSTWPSAWQHQDIGTGMSPGSASYQNGTFKITGAGVLGDLTNDQLHYVYQSISGDFAIEARVASMQFTDSAAGAGLMVRNSLEPNSPIVQFYVSLRLGYMASRLTLGGALLAGAESIGDLPIYIRLVRSGDNFSGFYSSDGVTWNSSLNPPRTVDLNDTVYVGMFVYSYVADVLETDTFDHVTIDTP